MSEQMVDVILIKELVKSGMTLLPGTKLRVTKAKADWLVKEGVAQQQNAPVILPKGVKLK